VRRLRERGEVQRRGPVLLTAWGGGRTVPALRRRVLRQWNYQQGTEKEMDFTDGDTNWLEAIGVEHDKGVADIFKSDPLDFLDKYKS